MKYLRLFKNSLDYKSSRPNHKYPTISLITEGGGNEDNEILYEPKLGTYKEKYLTFTIHNSGSFSIKGNVTGKIASIEYSIDGGEWQRLTSEEFTPELIKGQTISWKNGKIEDEPELSGKNGYFWFIQKEENTKFSIYGNIMSLLYGDDFKDKDSISDFECVYLVDPSLGDPEMTTPAGVFQGLFSSLGVINARKLILPTTGFCSNAFSDTFSYCADLIEPPAELTCLLNSGNRDGGGIFSYMFFRCENMERTPKIYLGSAGGEGYCEAMFEGCGNLKEIHWVYSYSHTSAALIEKSWTWTFFGIPDYGKLHVYLEYGNQSVKDVCNSINFANGYNYDGQYWLPLTWDLICYDVDGNKLPSWREYEKNEPLCISQGDYLYSEELWYVTSDQSFEYTTDYLYRPDTIKIYTPGEAIEIGYGQDLYIFREVNPDADTPSPIYFNINGAEISDLGFNVSGNIMSLIYGQDFIGKEDLTDFPNAFEGLFAGINILSARYLYLPETTSENCYNSMFRYSSLWAAPELPAKILKSGCYNSIFYECNGICVLKILAEDISAEDCLKDWVNGVQNYSFVTVIKKRTTKFPKGSSGLLDKWSVINIP